MAKYLMGYIFMDQFADGIESCIGVGEWLGLPSVIFLVREQTATHRNLSVVWYLLIICICMYAQKLPVARAVDDQSSEGLTLVPFPRVRIRCPTRVKCVSKLPK